MDKFTHFLSLEIGESGIQEPIVASYPQALILQRLARAYALGAPSMLGADVLAQCFVTSEQDYSYLKHLKDIQALIKEGWLSPLGKAGSSVELLQCELRLSSLFLRALEDESLEYDLPPKEPYVDHLEYLKDQFVRIECYKELALFSGSSRAKQFIKKQILALNKRISQRLSLSKIAIKIEQIFKQHALSENEQIIFLAILRQEYVGDFDNSADMNALINLVSYDEISRIKNRSLLEDSGKLISSGLVEYDEVLGNFGGISRNFFISEDTLQLIMQTPKRDKKKLSLSSLVKEQEFFELIEPATSIDDVVLNDKTKQLLNSILRQVDKKVLARLSSWGIKTRRGIDAKIIFYGEPGTGKTMSALSLAKSLKKQVLSFDCSKILSKYIGESEQNVRKIFELYKEICQKSKTEPILLLNEADQFLGTRIAGGSGSEKMYNQMQNIFLEQIERFSGILIATTNFLESLDSAFSRRFDYKIEFKRPDFAQRLAIWQQVLPKSASYGADFSIDKLALYELSGAQIVLVLKNTALKVAQKDEAIFELKDFEFAINTELNSAFDKQKRVGLL